MSDRHPTTVATGRTISLVLADITTLHVDVVVNAANSHLAGGGGVDGAIHRAGGAAIMQELREKYDQCPTGSAVITSAGDLPARYVIHAVGPRWHDGNHGEQELLAGAYRRAFELAAANGCTTVATASISTGIYGFPVELAALIAVEEAQRALRQSTTSLTDITWALFSERDLEAYQSAIDSLTLSL